MIVRRCLTLAIPIYLILSIEFGAIQAERWSRQVSNSEWIPLANPRATHSQIEQSNLSGLLGSSNAQIPQVPQISLPPALQQQYQDQLLQLQKTQENIQKLLLLQQQLRAQQQLLQSQGFLPSGFSNAGEEKRLHGSGLGSSTAADIAPEDLVPPLPATEALPPVFPAQNFLSQRHRVHGPQKQDGNVPQEFASLPGHEEIRESQRQGAKHLKEAGQGSLVPQAETGQDEEEEVQLVYVPADTLAQRGQPKRPRGRKQYPLRQHQHPQHHDHRENQGVDSGAITNEQDPYSQQLLQQIQMEREETTQFLKEERMKEIARLNEEQRALERKARLQQEALQREQELQRQREAEKKKKELEKLEEMARQRELERIREAREKQRLEELERRRLAEIRAKEEKRRAEEAAREREAERLAALERQKEREVQEALKQQRLLEKQHEGDGRVVGPSVGGHHEVPAQALPLIRDQQEFHRQHLGETKPIKSKLRGRQRQRNQYQEQQQSYREPTTTPSPNQPPLSVYMGSAATKTTGVKVSDVLRLLKNAKTIAVLDTVGPDTPQVFVGPTSLDPPNGYAKFDLPYLSSIDHNRVERKVDKLPFFVAPLSFDPPPGYSKIPFPAPHIGSVVVNTLDNSDPKDGDDQNPSPTPLIEPNSYSDGLEGGPHSTTPTYEPQTTVSYSQEPSSTPKYEQTYTPTSTSGYTGGRFRFRQFYGDDKPASVVSTSYYDDQRPTTRKQKYFDENLRTTESPHQSPEVVTSVSHIAGVSYSSTPSFKEGPTGPRDPATKGQDLAAQLALIDQELNQQRESQRYNTGGRYGQDGSQSSTGLGNNFEGEISGADVNDVRAPVGPTQYNLPAELPAISPHLPGLVNSLLDKNEAKLQASSAATTTSTTTTTTTTQRTPTTTYRPRSRQRTRVSSTRPRTTTQAPSTRVNVDRNRRPYNRSRSRFSTTTEEYHEASYEPTKPRTPETTLKYNVEHRRPASRTQKHRSRDKTTQQSEALEQGQNTQSQQSYDNTPHIDSGSPATGTPFLQSTAPESGFRQLDSSSGLNDFSPENYPSSTLGTTENYPQLPVNHESPLVSEDYSRSQNYPQNLPGQSPYRGYQQGTVEHTGLERTPVNGFNYQAQNPEAPEQGILQRPKEYQVDGKAENSDFGFATTVDPRLRPQEEQHYSSIYDVNAPQTQPVYSLTGQDNLHHLESEKIQSAVVGGEEQPIFVPLAENKQEDYELPSSTEIPLTEVTTETTTTSTTPVVIRQRLRGRIGTRLHHEPSVQTRNRGSQDEYVRFTVVNQDSRTSPSRQRTRPRIRTQNHGSQVQTDGNEYIKLHVGQQQRVATTTSAPTTTTTTTARPAEEDIDYGFIRPPNFRPAHPIDNRFPTPITYRPQLAEVPQQSLLPNDETAVESSPPQTQLLKNRPKYQLAPNRRLPGKPTTTPPPQTTTPIETTTTERIPVATLLPDDAIYTVRPKSRPDETKQSRTRSRVRRPGKKRVTTTSTTESVLEAHNELPLDENYPRVRPQQPTTEQQNLYEENYDGGGQYSPARNPAGHQFYDASSENYPSEFILNFGNYPEQIVQREEYDQTQLASNAPRKYNQPSRVKDDAHSTTADIYGAESQWSTKLTRTSFQPSFAVNQVREEAKDHGWFHESMKNANTPEIITAAPEVSSVTLVVSSDDKKDEVEEDESMLMGTTMFGRKTNTMDHTEKMNATTVVTSAPTTIREGNGSEVEKGQDKRSWLMDSGETSTEQGVVDLEKIQRKGGESPSIKKGTRRRRVRVRVRPAVDDFVTAESQHFNSALNGLFQDQYKYNPIRESKLPTPAPSSTEKSVLEDFLTEILKSDEPSRSTTTESPEAAWTMSPAMTTPINIPDDAEETTTENQATTSTTGKPEETTMKPYEDMVSEESREKMEQKEKTWSKKKIDGERKKNQDRWKPTEDSWSEKDVEEVLELSLLNKFAKENDVKEVSKNEDQSLDRTKLKIDSVEEGEGFGKIPGKEVMSDSSEITQESRDDHHAHPKNHRAKWSEVRYPSAFDHSQAWNQDPKRNSKSTSSIPGLVSKTEGNNSVKTLSDYVKAIFDSMKSADEETTTAKAEELEVTTQVPSETRFDLSSTGEEERSTMKEVDAKVTTQASFVLEDVKTVKDVESSSKETTQTTEWTTDIDLQDVTTLERATTTSQGITSSSTEPLATDIPATTTAMPPSTTTASNSTESILGKVLRTSTTTKVSHMTEICYRGRCVMTRPSQDDRFR